MEVDAWKAPQVCVENLPGVSNQRVMSFLGRHLVRLGLSILEEEQFDEYADEFEDHLVNTLEYHLPEASLAV